MVGVAVKVTLVPEQIGPDGRAAMLTLAVTFGFTVIVIVAEEAGLPETQAALLVITHLIESLLLSVLSEYVVLFVPTLVPFFFH